MQLVNYYFPSLSSSKYISYLHYKFQRDLYSALASWLLINSITVISLITKVNVFGKRFMNWK